ncbi:MAG: hypothetical protein IPM95_06985 [Sphingobacteriales bacterium]|nr:hypothetical protein [Sphingobacteriales bacterium]
MRLNHVNITIGKRGTGKTTHILKLIERHRKKVLIVDTIDHESYRKYRAVSPEMLPAWKKGIIRVYGHNFEDVFYQLAHNVTNALIVFEDCTKYIRGYIPDDVRNFIVDSKQKNLDLIFLYHGFGMVQPDMFRLSDSITLFKTNENIERYAGKIPSFEEVKQVNKIVQNSNNPYINHSIKIY